MARPTSDPFKYFRIEAGELLDQLMRGCLALEKSDHEEDLIPKLNRAAHSLKGAARLVELFPAGDAAHALEDAIARIQARGTAPTTDEVTGLLNQLDELQQIVSNALGEGVGESAGQSASASTEEAEPAASGQCVEREDAVPTVQSAIQVETSRLAPKKQQPVRPVDTAEELARVSTSTLDEIGRCAGEVLELAGRVNGWGEKLHTARRSILSAAAILDEARLAAERGPEARTDGGRRNVRALDAAFRGIDTAELRSDVEGVLQQIEAGFETIGPLARRLQGLSLETNLVAVAEYAHRFEKTVRDVAHETSAEVEYELIGDHIQADRLVLQTLTEPICHLLRNAVTHGIEPPERRRELGKSVKGTIRLRFEKTADRSRVVVEDDGGGLDVDHIREAAGIVGESAASPDTQQDAGDISEFIFRPGVTTKRRASQVAGRGIGLDAVRDAVHRLRGTVKVESEPGRFCRFTIDVPSHLDVMDVFVLRVGDQDLLVPLARLVQTSLVTSETIVNHAGAQAILLNDRPVRLVSLGTVLGIETTTAKAEERHVAVLKAGGDLLALAVNALNGWRKAVIKSVGPQLASYEVLAGAAVMSDGRPGFLLDTDVLVSLAKDRQFVPKHGAQAGPAEPRSILVVDDSLTTRMLEKALLESAGYRVAMARDSSEALGLLAQASYDLIIIDFAMPGMNGIELAECIRGTPARSDIPMLMLTSHGDDESKRKGLAAGMQAYLVKEQFDQTVFLDTVRGVIGETEEER